jgi:hypothetical protein
MWVLPMSDEQDQDGYMTLAEQLDVDHVVVAVSLRRDQFGRVARGRR